MSERALIVVAPHPALTECIHDPLPSHPPAAAQRSSETGAVDLLHTAWHSARMSGLVA